MADKRIHSNPYMLNKTLKTQREMYRRQSEGLISEYAKRDAKDTGTTPADVKGKMGLLKSDVLHNLENTIAVLDYQKVNNIMSTDALRIFEGGGFNRTSKYPENPDHLMFYDELHSKALSYLTNKQSTGQDLMWKTTQIADELTYSFNEKANSFSNYADVQESYRYFNSGKHGLTVFDLETFGGKNKFGKQELDMITEFTFDHYDSTLPGADRRRVTGFVGIPEELAAQYTKEFENFRDLGSLTEKQKVVARSLAKIGHEDTSIVEDPNKKGRFTIEKYGSNAEEIITKDRILAGINKSRSIRKKQEAFRYDGLMAWEKDFADAIMEIQNGDMTVAGHNIKRADIPWMNQALSQSSSPEMMKYMESKGFNGQINIPSHRTFDTLSVLQMAAPNPKAMDTAWPEELRKEVLKSEGHTPFQQEALVKRFYPDFYKNSGGAHASHVDVEALHKLITEAKVNGRGFFDQMMEFADESQPSIRSGATLKQDQKQLFYATKSLGGNFSKESLFGFKVDEFTGSFKTIDGVELADKLKPSKSFPEYMTKKGVSYTIDSIEQIEANDDYVKKMKQVNPALAVNNLVAMKISPVIDTESVGPYADMILKNLESSYIVGTQDDVKSFFNNNMFLYGEKDDSGEYKLVKGAIDKIGKSRLVEKDGKVALEKVESSNLIKETVQDGTFVAVNDFAARNFRENKMSRYEALGRFSEKLNEMAAADNSDLPIEEKKKTAVGKLLESSREVARKTSEGRAHTLNSQAPATELLQDILGYKDFSTGKQVVHPRTIDNAIASLEHYESISDEINLLLGEVEKRTPGSSKAEKSYLFSQGLEAIQAKALEKTDQSNFNITDGFVRNFEQDYFEVDVSSILDKRKGAGTSLAKVMEDSNPDGVMKIDLRPGGEHKLIRSLVDDSSKVNHEQEAIKQLDAFVNTMQRENGLLTGIYGKGKEEFLQSNTSTTFARKIIDELAEVRKTDPAAGFLSPNRVHNVQGASELAGKLTEDEILEALDERFSRFKQGSVTSIGTDPVSRRIQAQSIVDDILMDPFNEKDLGAYGYNSEQINKLKLSRDVRRKDYIDYVDNLLAGVSKTNMNLVTDSKAGIFGLVDQGEYIDLKNVPRDRFTDGIFYTEIGRNRVATELHLNAGDKPSDTKLTSGISEAMKESNWNLERSIDNAVRRGEDPDEKVLQWVNKVARSIREGSAITMFDEQDMKSQFEMYEKGVINALPNMHGLDKLDLTNKGEFLKRVSRNNFSFDSMGDTDKQLWALNRHEILRHVANESGNEDIAYLVNNVSSRGKHSAVESGRVRIDPVQSELELFNRSSRDIENQIRYLAFREDYARDKLSDLGIGNRVDLGAPLRTELGHGLSTRTFEGTRKRAYTEFVTDRIALTSAAYKDKLIQAKRSMTNAEEIDAIDSLLIKGNMTEGGAIGNARIADALFQNYDRQKVSFKRELLTDHENNVDRLNEIDKLRTVVPEIKISDDGKIEFAYKKGHYVERFDKLFDEIEQYGGTSSPVGAKYDGALRFGFFTKGQHMIADESDVIEHVTDIAIKRGINIQNEGQFMSIAEELYDANFYVERLSSEPYRKVMEDRVEKHMTAFAYYGLGESGDSRINKALSELGLDSQKGNVLDRRFFDELLDDKNISNSVLSDISTKKLTRTSYLQAITKAGYDNVEEFQEALERERFLPSDVMRSVLGADMSLINEDVGHQNRNVPFTTAVNDMIDHETRQVMAGDPSLSREAAQRQATRTVYDEVKDAFVKDGEPALRLGDDGKLIMPEMKHFNGDYLDSTKMREAYDARMGKDSFSNMLNAGQVTRHSYAVQQDYTGISGAGMIKRPEIIASEDGSIRVSPLSERDDLIRSMSKGAKITDREINMLETARFDQALIDRVSQELSPEDFRNAFGHAVNETKSGFVLKDDYEGKTVLGGFTDEVRRNQFAKPGEALVTSGNSPEYLRNTVDALSNTSGGNVGLRTAEEVYSIAMNTEAMKFNNNPGNLDNLVSKHGFEVVKLSELDRMTKGDGNYLLNESPDSLYRKNLIIDLQDEVITPDIINSTNHGSRYIAMGQLPSRKFGDNIIQQGAQQTVGSLIAARNQLADTANMTDYEVETQKKNIVNAVDGFNDELSKAVFSKNGLLRNVSETRLERSTMGKASLMDIQDILEMKGFPDVLDNAMIDGKSIMEHHQSGTLMDFKILSEQQFKEMGVFDKSYLSDLGMSENDMRRQLRSGVLGFTHRFPTIYEGSVRPTALILSDKVKGNQAIEYAAGALSSHMDSDGDSPRTWLASYTGQDGSVIDSIQYKSITKNDKVDAQVEEAFNNQKAMMYRNAVVTNKYFSDKLAEDVNEMSNIKEKVTDKLLTMRSTSPDGYVRPGFDRKPSPQEAAILDDQYRKVENIAIEQKINDTPSLRALEGSKARNETLNMFAENMDDQVDYLTRAVQTLDPSEREAYSRAADYHIESIIDKATETSKLKRSSAGEINLPIYQVNKVRNLSHNVLDSDEHRLLTHVLEASEEAFLSPKHSDAKIISNSLTMQEFNRALRSATGSPMRGDSTGTALLEDWFQTNLPGRFKPAMFEGAYTEEEAYKKSASLISKVFDDRDNIQRYNMFMASVGSRVNGIDSTRINDALIYPEESKNLMTQTYSALSDLDVGYRGEQTTKRRVFEEGATNYLESSYTPPTDPNLRTTAKNVLESAKGKMSKLNVSGKDLAFGALGIAGAVMVAGFVGGNPSKPATTQASEQREGLYDIPSMADQDLSIQPNSGGGYVVNINANSDRGRAHVEEAIQQAMAQSYNSTNINVSMNIRDSSGNITDRNIEQMIRGSFS
ncbi:hypothetical protein P8918_13485 [Bacillus spizizenii]|nr:hypothetical protein [Bacillus spizizenii]MEC0842040.1 hypothetical protein [Bacillus spizizenii]